MLLVQPTDGPERLQFHWHVDDDVIPQAFRPAVRAGVEAAMAEESWDQPVTVRVVGGGFQQVDSSERGYRQAACIAFRAAVSRERAADDDPTTPGAGRVR